MTADDDDKMLAPFFEAARDAETPSEALTARVLADADRVLAGNRGPAHQPIAPPAPGVLARIADALGGWLGLSGLAAACAAGVMIGAVLPDQVDDLTAGSVSALLGAGSAAGYTGLEAVVLADRLEGLE